MDLHDSLHCMDLKVFMLLLSGHNIDLFLVESYFFFKKKLSKMKYKIKDLIAWVNDLIEGRFLSTCSIRISSRKR